MTNPVKYAEDVLDVHGPWEDAKVAIAEHEHLGMKLVYTRQTIRAIKSEIDERKMEMTSEAPALWPDLSATARKEALKVAMSQDDVIVGLERKLRSAEDELTMQEQEVHHLERKIYVLTARMSELGGLLQFYAAAKVAAQKG